MYGIGKGLPGIIAINQQVRHRGQAFLMFTEHRQCTCSVGDIRGGHGNRMGEYLRIYGTTTFDAGYLLTRVIPLLPGQIHILYALRINDHERCLLVPTTADTDRANPIFLRLLKQAERFLSSPLAATFRYYRTVQKTSYKSTTLGLLFFLACPNTARMDANCSRLLSLG